MLIQTGFLWCVNNIDDDVNDKKEGYSCSQEWPCHLRKEVLLITAVRGGMIHDHALDDDHNHAMMIITMLKMMIVKEKER